MKTLTRSAAALIAAALCALPAAAKTLKKVATLNADPPPTLRLAARK